MHRFLYQEIDIPLGAGPRLCALRNVTSWSHRTVTPADCNEGAMDLGITQMKSLPEKSPAFPDIREQAFDELRRLTPYLPHASLIDAVICNPPERNRSLSGYERTLLTDLAHVLNSDVRHDPHRVIDSLQSHWHCMRDDQIRLESLRAALVEAFSITEEDARAHRPSPETSAGLAGATEQSLGTSQAFRQQLEGLKNTYGRPHGYKLMAAEISQLDGPWFTEGVGAIFEDLRTVRTQEGHPRDTGTSDFARTGPIFKMMARDAFNAVAAALPGELRLPSDWVKRRALMELSLMVGERELARLSPDFALDPEEQKRVVGFASFGLAQIRAECKEPNAGSFADVFRRNLTEYRRHVRVLTCFANLGQILRQLLQLLRVMNAPVVERDLSYWGAPVVRQSPCDLVVLDLVHSVHQHVTELGDEGAAVQTAREDFAAFCLSRLQTTKAIHGETSSAGPIAMVERQPVWRVGYLRALQSLRCNPQGKGHRHLHWLQRGDPDELVRKTAAEVYPVLRECRGAISNSSPKRPFITAIWWLLQAHLLDLSVEPDANRVDLTREAFMRRTSERYPQSPSRAPIIISGPFHPPFAAV